MEHTAVIRRLESDDAAAFRALRMEGARRHPREFRFSPKDEDGQPLSAVRERLAGSFVAGAFAGGELVGIGGWTRLAGAKLRHKGLLWGMYLRPSARGSGTAGRIVDAIVNDARGEVETLVLTVVAHNAAARRLYERHGFVAYGTEPRAVKVDGRYVDEVLMAKDLRER